MRLVRFFFGALFDGVKNNMKTFIGMAGFVGALGAVFAASEGYHHFFGKKPATVADENLDPNDPANSADGANSRNPASVPNGNPAQNNIRIGGKGGVISADSGRGNSGESAGGNPGSPSISTPPRVDGSSANQNPGRGPSSVGSGGYVPQSPSSPAVPQPSVGASGSGLASGNDLIGGGSPQVSGPATTQAQNSSTGTNTTTTSSGSKPTSIEAVSGFSFTSGGGVFSGNGLQVQAAVGEVTSSNYHQNAQFTLISGVAGTFTDK